MSEDKIKQLKELILKDPDNLANYTELAGQYIEMNDLQKAFDTYQEILKRDENDIYALLNSGSILFYDKQYDESIKYYKKGISIEPENPMLHYNLGNVYAEIGDFSNSIREYKAAMSGGMQNAQIFNAVGILFSDNNYFADSKEYFLKAIKLEPNNPKYLADYGILCQKAGKLDEAEAGLKQSYMLNKDATVALSLANLYVQMQKRDKAKEYFDSAIELRPNYYSALVCRAIFESDEKDSDSAIRDYKSAIELEPSKANAYMLLAHLLTNEKRYEEAIEIYKKTLTLTNNKKMAYVFIANSYMLNNDMKNAIYYYRQAMKNSPDNQEIALIFIDILDEYIEEKYRAA